jgi:hypothetical protein
VMYPPLLIEGADLLGAGHLAARRPDRADGHGRIDYAQGV